MICAFASSRREVSSRRRLIARPAPSRAEGFLTIGGVKPQTAEDFEWAVVLSEVDALIHDMSSCFEHASRPLARRVLNRMVAAGIIVEEPSGYLQPPARASPAEDEDRDA